ncbi:MAG: DUF1232 domain-containing protein [Myxococcaceae bacterium]|nr:DUF1232 domain-containing protein [Myxococcaceae bacterium]
MNALETRGFGSKLVSYFKDPTVSVWRKFAGVAALAYLVMPLDLLPDVIPVIGWLDDIGVLSAAAMFIVREVKRHAETKASTMVVDVEPRRDRTR